MLHKIWISIAMFNLVILLAGCDNAEIKDVYFANRNQLAEAEEPGNWIPSFIPRSAIEIRARYKIDTGAQLLTFYFERLGDLALTGKCNAINLREVEFPPTGFLNVAWWPTSLSAIHPADRKSILSIYRCERETFLAVIEAEGRHQAFYWRIPH